MNMNIEEWLRTMRWTMGTFSGLRWSRRWEGECTKEEDSCGWTKMGLGLGRAPQLTLSSWRVHSNATAWEEDSHSCFFFFISIHNSYTPTFIKSNLNHLTLNFTFKPGCLHCPVGCKVNVGFFKSFCGGDHIFCWYKRSKPMRPSFSTKAIGSKWTFHAIDH